MSLVLDTENYRVRSTQYNSLREKTGISAVSMAMCAGSKEGRRHPRVVLYLEVIKIDDGQVVEKCRE